MLSDFPIMLYGFTYYALILNEKCTTDKSDDASQPSTTQYLSSDDPRNNGNNQYNPTSMNAEYAAMSAGHPTIRHADGVGECPTCYADLYGSTPGGFSHMQSFGPYTIPTGDSIRIVMAEAMNGLNRAKNREIGENWGSGTAPYTLPNGSTTNDRDEYKNAWVYTGQDSLFATFQRALSSYQSDFTIPQAPPPPDYFEVNDGEDGIELHWSDNATAWSAFAGYQVYRATGRPDTTYQLIMRNYVLKRI